MHHCKGCSLKKRDAGSSQSEMSPPLGLQSRYLRLHSFPVHPAPAGPPGPSGKNSPEDKQGKLGYQQWLLKMNWIIILTSYSETIPNQKSHIINR